jgi:hypothetical protein
MAHNGQGLLAGLELLLIQPGTAARLKYEIEGNNK